MTLNNWDGPFFGRCYDQYVLSQPQTIRKSIGLVDNIFNAKPTMMRLEKVPLIFGRKEAQHRNARRQEDYEDQKRAINEFKSAYGIKEYSHQKNKETELSERATEAMLGIIAMMPEENEVDQSTERISANAHGTNSTYEHEEEADNEQTFYESLAKELEDIRHNQVCFVDCSGAYRRWGESFVDYKGNWCNWGEGFYDYDGNYIRWGETYKDSSGAYRRWGDDFVDCSGNWVRLS